MNNWDTRRLRKARMLLPTLNENVTGTWADLGCGDGIFTGLLRQQLQPGSTIYAVDKDAQALQRLDRRLPGDASDLPDTEGGAVSFDIPVYCIHADFTNALSLPALNGLLLANSLHFVTHKRAVLARLMTLLAPRASVFIIEYNNRNGNFAVPYPIAADDCLALMASVGLQEGRIVARAPSSFLDEMYTAQAVWPGDPAERE